MDEIWKKFVEALPFVRSAPYWFQVLFVVWVALTSGAAVSALVIYLRQTEQAPKLDGFVVDLADSAYISTANTPITGRGLPSDLSDFSLKVVVTRIVQGQREQVTQPEGRLRGFRSRDGVEKWRYDWLRLDQPGEHEVDITFFRKGKEVFALEPVKVVVGEWAVRPSVLAVGISPKPGLPDPDDVVVPTSRTSTVVNLSQFMRIRDQGDAATAPAFSTATAMEIAAAILGIAARLVLATYRTKRRKAGSMPRDQRWSPFHSCRPVRYAFGKDVAIPAQSAQSSGRHILG